MNLSNEKKLVNITTGIIVVTIILMIITWLI